MTRNIALGATLLGAALFVAGVALIYVPAAMILAGAAITALGLTGVSYDRT